MPLRDDQGAFIRLVLWAAYSHAECRVWCSHLLLFAPRSVGQTELPLQTHVSQKALSKIPIAANRPLLPLSLSGGQKYSTHLQISFVKDAQKAMLKNAYNFYFHIKLSSQWTEVSAELLQGLCQKHKGSSLHSFFWTSGRLQKVRRILSVWESFISRLPKMFVLESVFS